MFFGEVQLILEKFFSKFTRFFPNSSAKKGFFGGIAIGLSLGLLWTPCVGPILASVISLALSENVSFQALVITSAYSLGTAFPMFIIMYSGSNIFKKVPWLVKNSANIQKIFALIMIFTAIAIFYNIDRRFQTFILNNFPQYGISLTRIEDNIFVKDELSKLDRTSINDEGDNYSSIVNKPNMELAPEIIPGGEWYNSDPLTIESLRGKVILIDFWTYTCINCQRTLPYIRDWWSKYRDQGLVIIGVHSPEFEFEKNSENVKKAIQDFQLTYPIVQDNEFATWRAYDNRYWPAKYLIDKNGYIRYNHFGEGAYDETELKIQELIKEIEDQSVTDKIDNPKYQVFSKTPETYLGYERIANFASNENIQMGEKADYTFPEKLGNNQIAYSGSWIIDKEYANPQKNSKLEINFEAKEVFLVMRPKIDKSMVKVMIDGKEENYGEDVKEGIVTVDSDRLYKLVNLSKSGRHILLLEFLDSNTEVYAFTFG
jgi:thiol-disulfide isomerase/thioredoxin